VCTYIYSKRRALVPCLLEMCFRIVFLNCRAAAQYWALASIILGRERFSWNLSFFMNKYFIVEIF